ncbi:membrane zinc transporter [Histoplasma capsulatum var. duboisii H88]|uniref:Membrane zinc transporter n=1 Tax=Ajellomyces capsulatus (strain H88) TaxID=544711 RepID=F0URY4_AJEC8|nr:membrane zinc transporter [Histoplasma capsulatum var. duboisii H88]QSS50667.1 membrane zinc transporter [Histoplasma capsulatum var. duboisii H88]
MLPSASLAALLPRAEEGSASDACDTGNEFDGRLGLRISAVFVILIGSSLGALLPVWARFASPKLGKMPTSVLPWAFFVAKYFGSGVIVATAFIHLLAPAHEALTNRCLTGPLTAYPWVEGIMLITIIVLFFTELMVIRFARFGDGHIPKEIENGSQSPSQVSHAQDQQPEIAPSDNTQDHMGQNHEYLANSSSSNENNNNTNSHSRLTEKRSLHNHVQDHHHHSHSHGLPSLVVDYSAQLTSIFILEFGIIFHSIFIGLTLAVAGQEFVTLYVVLTFHQTFEGLGLGSRLATVPWPRSKKLTPYLLAIAFGLSTPISIAVGLGVRMTYPAEGRTTLIVNGVFDSISAGILIYTALVELMAHEFVFSPSMQRAPLREVLAAFGLLCLGAGLMALLGNWA